MSGGYIYILGSHTGTLYIDVTSTRFPGFPVQLGGSGALLAAFLNESRIRGRVQRSVQEIRV